MVEQMEKWCIRYKFLYFAKICVFLLRRFEIALNNVSKIKKMKK